MSNAPQVDSIVGSDDVDLSLYSPSPRSLDILLAVPKNERSSVLCWSILLVGFTSAVVANLVFRNATGIGLNMFVLALVFFVGWFVIARGRTVPRWRKLCAVAAILYAAALGIRASEILFGVNLLLFLGFSALACSPAVGRAISSVSLLVVSCLQVGINAVMGALLFGVEVPWGQLKPKQETGRVAWRILIGLIIAAPFLLIFGSLFSQADSQFKLIFVTAFTRIIQSLFSNLWFTFWLFILALGLLRSSFFSRPITHEHLPMKGQRIGIVESATVLILLNVLFLIFVGTQLPYLFGGQNAVSATPDLVWSAYARRGFFELATVVALVVPTLMLFTNLTRTSTARQSKLLTSLCVGLSVLTGVVVVSAFQRMMLYTANFGLSELRIYVSTFIVMLAVILVLLNTLHVMKRQELFVPMAFCVGVIFSLGIQAPNIQGIVAADIIRLHTAGKNGDMEYLTQLSTDAVPAILNSELPAAERRGACVSILNRAGLMTSDGLMASDGVIAQEALGLYSPVSTLRAIGLIERMR